MRYYTFRNKKFELSEEDKDKYVVVACARFENDYIVEWVEHYLNLGFDKIFIGDNNDIGDNSLRVILENFIIENKVEIFDIQGEEFFQKEFYSMFSTVGNYKWCAYFDCDEFLELNAFDNIKIFLETLHKDDDIVEFNWIMYSNNGAIKRTNEKIQDRYKYPLPLIFADNFEKKSMISSNYKCQYDIHGPSLYEYGANKYIGYTEGYLKHYKYKSIEEQIINIKNRGSCTMGKNFKSNDYKFFNFGIDYFNILKQLSLDERVKTNLLMPQIGVDVLICNIPNFERIHGCIAFVLENLFLNSGKIFYLKMPEGYNFPEYWFTVLFEYALQTGNKITLIQPILKNGYRYQHINFD